MLVAAAGGIDSKLRLRDVVGSFAKSAKAVSSAIVPKRRVTRKSCAVEAPHADAQTLGIL